MPTTRVPLRKSIGLCFGYVIESFFHSMPNSFHDFVFFFFHRDEKKWVFLPCRTNFFLKLNFKKFKVVLEAAEAVEAII